MQPHTGAADGIHGAGSLVVAAAQGGLAYALLAPKWFARVHPVWGGIFAVLAVINLADAVD
jgi:sugar phosphate permease